MRNDVHPPPQDPSSQSALRDSPPRQHHDMSELGPVKPGPDHTLSDVTLYDHPSLTPSGSGNFWSLALLGIIVFVIAGVAVVALWMMVGW